MPIQAPQWTEFLSCPLCYTLFDVKKHRPISLGCSHTFCMICLEKLNQSKCPFDQVAISQQYTKFPVNYGLLQLVDVPVPTDQTCPLEASLGKDKKHYAASRKSLEELAIYLKPLCSNESASSTQNYLSRPMMRKLVSMVGCQLFEEEGRVRIMRGARSLGERAATELILQHQSTQQLSSNLWAAVRTRGCQFLGPAMQEEVLKLILLALEDGSPLSRKVLVQFVVQKMEVQYPQASKTAIGHVVQLLYRASCFKVTKRNEESSLMELKEEFRIYDSLRREHDAQIVQIATEAGLRIAPDQWSSLLYGDAIHKSHMQSIVDKLQNPESFNQSVDELMIVLQRSNDPGNLTRLHEYFRLLASVDPSPESPSPSWENLAFVLRAIKTIIQGLIPFMQTLSYNRRHEPSSSHNAKYKTNYCRDYMAKTMCPRGALCTFAHSKEELEKYRAKSRRMGPRPPDAATYNKRETPDRSISEDRLKRESAESDVDHISHAQTPVSDIKANAAAGPRHLGTMVATPAVSQPQIYTGPKIRMASVESQHTPQQEQPNAYTSAAMGKRIAATHTPNRPLLAPTEGVVHQQRVGTVIPQGAMVARPQAVQMVPQGMVPGLPQGAVVQPGAFEFAQRPPTQQVIVDANGQYTQVSLPAVHNGNMLPKTGTLEVLHQKKQEIESQLQKLEQKPQNNPPAEQYQSGHPQASRAMPPGTERRGSKVDSNTHNQSPLLNQEDVMTTDECVRSFSDSQMSSHLVTSLQAQLQISESRGNEPSCTTSSRGNEPFSSTSTVDSALEFMSNEAPDYQPWTSGIDASRILGTNSSRGSKDSTLTSSAREPRTLWKTVSSTRSSILFESEDDFIPFNPDAPFVSRYGPISRHAKAKMKYTEPVQVTADLELDTKPTMLVSNERPHAIASQVPTYFPIQRVETGGEQPQYTMHIPHNAILPYNAPQIQPMDMTQHGNDDHSAKINQMNVAGVGGSTAETEHIRYEEELTKKQLTQELNQVKQSINIEKHQIQQQQTMNNMQAMYQTPYGGIVIPAQDDHGMPVQPAENETYMMSARQPQVFHQSPVPMYQQPVEYAYTGNGDMVLVNHAQMMQQFDPDQAQNMAVHDARNRGYMQH
ncbi:unnamed protein product [Owenia fusiformis]|uniref:RING-type E3 ubiquitin transferase n=2 Tax=Owenia fusiformis TaxID=6347 RepID=A0A8J1TX69_OWEFU|nr:unnamed protein product [Owenia fusiformis]